MSLFLREGRDGRRAPGYLLYLLGGGIAVAVILFLHRHSGAPPATIPRRRGRSVGVAAITQPAALLSPVNVAEKAAGDSPGRSFRLAAPRPASPAPAGPAPRAGFDAVDAALSAAPALPAEAAAEISPYAALPPAYAPLGPAASEAGRQAGHAIAEGDGGSGGEGRLGRLLFGYRDRTADPTEAGAKAAGPASGDVAGRMVAPRGSLVHVVLLTTVDTGNPAAVIQFGVERSLILHRRVLLPFGTRLLGRLSGRPARDRLNLTADTILFPEGRELAVSASAVEADDSGASLRPGVAAAYFPPPPWAQLAPYVSDFFTGFMGLLESRAQSQFALGVGGLSLQGSSPAAVRAPLAQASSAAIQDFTQARLKEIEERYASYYLIPAGTDFWLQLDNDLVFPLAHATRSVE